MRHSNDESPDVVLARLYANEPRWEDHPKADTHPAAKDLSKAHETRQSFDQRHAAWEAAVEREKALREE